MNTATAHIPALILCGGTGSRLQPVVSDVPKALATVAGKPVIHRIFDHLIANGIEECVLCTGYMGAMIQKTIGNRYEGLRIMYSHETSPLGTGGAVKKAVEDLSLAACLVINGDTLFDYDVREFIEWSVRSEAVATILLTALDDAQDYGLVVTDDAHRVLSFQEKPTQPTAGLVNTGVYYFQAVALDDFLSGSTLSMETDILPSLVNGRLYASIVSGAFQDIGTPGRFEAANKLHESEKG